MRPIDADPLYEKACNLEAQALSYVEKIVNDETKTEEWRIWSAILAERTAFKHDVFDSPTITPNQKTGYWMLETIDNQKWCRCSECNRRRLAINVMGSGNNKYCPHCGSKNIEVKKNDESG